MKPATFSTEINLTLAAKLRSDLDAQGFTFEKPPYTVFSAKKKGITCVLYESGKLVVQGKEKDPFIEFYLEPEILKDFTYSYPESKVNLQGHIGVDESGKGDFFGPLCIAGVFAEGEGIKKLLSLGVKDSKKMSDKAIQEMAQKIQSSFSYEIISIFPEKYNALYAKFRNLNYLLGWAHGHVIATLSQKTSCKEALIDQFADQSVVANEVKKKGLDIRLEQKTHAEEDPVVAAASILARNAFLLGLKKLEDTFSTPLLKGASKEVLQRGIQLVEKFGPSILNNVAKTHFKTHDSILFHFQPKKTTEP